MWNFAGFVVILCSCVSIITWATATLCRMYASMNISGMYMHTEYVCFAMCWLEGRYWAIAMRARETEDPVQKQRQIRSIVESNTYDSSESISYFPKWEKGSPKWYKYVYTQSPLLSLQSGPLDLNCLSFSYRNMHCSYPDIVLLSLNTSTVISYVILSHSMVTTVVYRVSAHGRLLLEAEKSGGGRLHAWPGAY